MERLRKLVALMAFTPDSRLSELPFHQRVLLIPVLSFASSLYRLSLSLRRRLFLSSLLPTHRLPVPVISVGNLTWGGNGKTPMVEFIASFFDEIGIPPLVLTRGYGGGDEVKMLKRHLLRTSARIGVGSNRKAIADSLFERHGFMDVKLFLEKLSWSCKSGGSSVDEKIGVVVLDDGMQHWSLFRDVEIVMVNGLMPWGNNHLIPRGPLREPLTALTRADVVVVHHAGLVSDTELENIKSTIRKVSASIPIFFSRLSPSYFFEIKNYSNKLPLSVVHDMVVLCVSAIGFPDAFVQGLCKLGPLHVDRLDFTDHHLMDSHDIALVRQKVKMLETEFKVRAVIVITEKDYYRDPVILKQLHDSEVFILCSSIQFLPSNEQSAGDFTRKLRKLLQNKCSDNTPPV
ncbi:putative tetraacyldisaccharide 4'-kinase [Dioscorea sansibarensis]